MSNTKKSSSTNKTSSKSNPTNTRSTNNANVSSNDLANIRKKLKKGDISLLAEQTDFSATHVSNVLSGERGPNKTIITAAKKLTSRRK